MKNLLLVLLLVCSWSVFGQPQNPLLYTFSSSGGATGSVHPTTNIPTYFASVGQPMVYARPTAFNNGGGVLNVTNYLFTGGSSGDAIAPVISFSASPGPSVVEGLGTLISVTITDNINVALGRLYYKPITGTADDFVQLELTAPASGNTFTANLPADAPDNMGLEFYFEAFDASNKTISPASGSYYSYFTFSPATMPVFAFGNTQNKYRIMAMPLNLTSSNRQVSFIYGALSELDEKNIRMYRYDPQLESPWLEFANGDFQTMDQGKGYFTILLENKNLNLGAQKAPANNRSSLFSMTLQPGWNMIGNPYTVPINWDNVFDYPGNNISQVGQLNVFGNSGYSNPTTLNAYEGAFVFLNGSSSVNLSIPFEGQTAPGNRTQKETFATDLSSSKWKLNLNIQQGEIQSQLSGVGMHPDAQVTFDRYDNFNPPSFLEFAEINFAHPEHSLGAFAFDMVPKQDEYIWRFTTRANTGNDATLRWDNTGFGDNDIELFLYDVGTNSIVNMREENHYEFSPGQSKEFKVYYGKDLREHIGPDAITVDEPYPNPFNGKNPVKFVVGLPDNLVSSYPVEMTIHNSVGIPVHAQKQTLTPGLHTLIWTGRMLDDEMPPAGFYFYTIKVGAQSFTGKVIFTNQND